MSPQSALTHCCLWAVYADFLPRAVPTSPVNLLTPRQGYQISAAFLRFGAPVL